MSNFDLVISIVSHRVVSAPTVHSLDNLRYHLKGINYTLAIYSGDALIGRGRSQACTKFLKEIQAPYMLFIDDDIIFKPEDIAKVYQHLYNGYDVIGGIYPVRGASQLSSYGYEGKLAIDDGIHEIEYLATGFMGVSRRILEKVKDDLALPWLNESDWSQCWPFFENGRCYADKDMKKEAKRLNMPVKKLKEILDRMGIRWRKSMDSIYISEDWDFCEKVRQVGGKIYADTSIQLGHMREQAFTPADVRNIQSQAEQQQRMYGAITHQSQIAQGAVKDLGEFLHMPENRIQENMESAQTKLSEQWYLKKSVDDFYMNNETYLFDSAWFNMAPHFFQQRINQLINISGLKVLDIGCGIGTTVFMMAEQGCDAIGWDINQRCLDFANWKKKKYEMGGQFTIEKPDFSQFDLIIAIDTLEHIEDLKGFLAEIGRQMKYGAKFYHSDYFPQRANFPEQGEDIVWPMHFEEHAEHLSEWLKEAGLIEWDSRWAIKR